MRSKPYIEMKPNLRGRLALLKAALTGHLRLYLDEGLRIVFVEDEPYDAKAHEAIYP